MAAIKKVTGHKWKGRVLKAKVFYKILHEF